MSSPAPAGLLDRLRALDPERYADRLAPAGAALCVLAAVIGHWAALPLALVGLVLLLVSCLSRDEGLIVLGPFVRAELVRATRRRFGPAFWRVLYATGVFLVLVLTYYSASERYGSYRRTPQAVLMERAAITFFSWFAALQFLYLAYLTVQLLSSVVAEERDAKRLDFLLATDLRSREILIGKAVGRLPQLLDPVLASLPILSLLPFFGGVPPGFVIGAAVATGVTVLSLAGVSFFASVISPTRAKAAELVVSLSIFFVMFTGVPWALVGWRDGWTFPVSVGIESPVVVGDVVKVLSCGNPVTGVINLVRELSGGANADAAVSRAIRWYTVFHLGVFLAFGLMAVARLRPAARAMTGPAAKVPETGQPATGEGVEQVNRQTGAAPPRAKRRRFKWLIDLNPPPRKLPRPPVSDRPVYWWEVFGAMVSVYGEDWRKEMKATAVFGAIFVVFFHLLLVVGILFPKLGIRWEMVRMIAGFTAWGAALGGTIGIAIRAASSVAREREKDTLEALMLTGMTCREILRQKWLGCVRLFSPLAGFFLGVLGASLVTFALHPASLFSLLLIVPVHVAFAASIGLYFSVRMKSVNRANLWMWATLAGGMFVAGNVLVAAHRIVSQDSYSTEAFPIMVVVPVAASAGVTFLPVDWRGGRTGQTLAVFGGAAVGTMLYGLLAWVFWRLAVGRFEREWERRTPPQPAPESPP
jgi:ABC-type Na+ efflux pump permease subunit